MDTQTEESVFQIRLTENGKRFINKVSRIIWPVIIFSLVITVLDLISSLQTLFIYFPRYRRYGYSQNFVIYPVFRIVIELAVEINSIYFLKFVLKMKRSAELNDENGFNRSFRFLFISSILWLIGIILTAVITGMAFKQLLLLN